MNCIIGCDQSMQIIRQGIIKGAANTMRQLLLLNAQGNHRFLMHSIIFIAQIPLRIQKALFVFLHLAHYRNSRTGTLK